jgi:phosphatidyl-myo-inositol dimannoside synthase
MKLLLTLDFPPERGGIQKYLFEKAAHTFGTDDRIAVGARRRTGKNYGDLPCAVAWHANILSRFNKKWSIVNLLFALLSALRKFHGTVDVECGNAYAGIAPWAVSLVRPVQYRVYTHGAELLCLHNFSLRSMLLKSVLRRAEALYVTGTFVEGLLRKAGIATAAIMDPPRIALGAPLGGKERRSADTGPLRLLSAGRLVPHKGHAVLLEACSALPAGIRWHLVIAGSGPEENPLLQLVDRLGLAGRVAIKTDLDDAALAAEYRNADLFVLPSIATANGIEGFGVVLLEAMAAGTPIIASKTGGVPAVLDNGACGLLVAPGNATVLRDAIVFLAGNAEERKRLSANAFNRVRDHYAW